MTKLLQAADAAALVRQNVDRYAKSTVESILESVEYAARQALTYTVDDMHSNPDVQESIAKQLEALGYKVEIIENRKIKISWSK